LEASHPEYVDRLGELVAAGRIEILGGAFFEPILAMIPSRDRIGQIRTYSRWLKRRFGPTVRGLWVPERVWEQSFTRDLVDAGIEYTVLDDFHFKNAGLSDAQLVGRFLTEDDGRLMSIFPGSERLRYTIPFADPQATIDHLAQVADGHPDSVVVFGDDGEKFGSWPQTHKHVYDDGWLARFFDALVENQKWIRVTTLGEAHDHVPPAGKIYLPDSSYREMTEWALPAEQQVEFERLAQEMKNDPRWPALRRFIRGGFWRNFKVKYPESDEMYARMMGISRRVMEAAAAGTGGGTVDRARTELYRAQCNCAYWHGAFGGIYLPHLRNAVYHHLIAAEGFLNQAAGKPDAWAEATAADLNFDARSEIQLANDKLLAMIAPSRGGQLYELDVRAANHNLLATLARRPEAYHRKVLAGPTQAGNGVASIHERVVFKQEGLDRRLQYDDHARKSLLDLFYDGDATLESVASGQAAQRGDFLHGQYLARLRRNPDRVQVVLWRDGTAGGLPLKLTKAVTLSAGSSTLEVSYQLEGLPKPEDSPGEPPLHLAVEMNFAGMPAGVEDRYFHDGTGRRLGELGTRLDLAETNALGLVDEWLGIGVLMKASRPTGIWTFPIESVSQSESGFELVHQSVVVMPHWHVTPDADGTWRVVMQWAIDTSRAKNPSEDPAVAATL
jgi:hypothetical protein